MSVIERIVGSLRFLFTGEPKLEQYITQMPSTQQARQLAELMNKKVLQENAQLKAEVLKFRAKDEEQQLEEQRKKEEIQVLEKVKKHNEETEKLEKAKAVKLVFSGLKELPTFFLRNNTSFYKFKGIYLKEDEDGYLFWYPLLNDGKKDKIFKKPAGSFNDFFRDEIGLVSQLRGGKIDSNFDITKNNVPVLIKKNRVKDKKGKKYDIIHLAEQEERKLLEKIEEYKTAYLQSLKKIEELQIRIVYLTKDLSDNEVTSKVSKKELDIMKSTVATLADKRPASTIAIANTLASSQDTMINQVLSERMNLKYAEVIDDYREKLKDILSEEEFKVGEERVKGLIDQAAERIKSDIKFSMPHPRQEVAPKVQQVGA